MIVNIDDFGYARQTIWEGSNQIKNAEAEDLQDEGHDACGIEDDAQLTEVVASLGLDEGAHGVEVAGQNKPVGQEDQFRFSQAD